jgi:hypothetical protein
MSMLKREIFYKFWILFKPNWSLFAKVSNKTEKRKGKDQKKIRKGCEAALRPSPEGGPRPTPEPDRTGTSLSLSMLTCGPHQRHHRLRHVVFPRILEEATDLGKVSPILIRLILSEPIAPSAPIKGPRPPLEP